MAALVTLAAAKTFLSIKGTTDDALITNLVSYATDISEKYCGRPLAEQAYTALRLQGPRSLKLYPAAAPIKLGTVTVTVDKVAQTVWGQESDGDLDAFDVLIASDDPHDVKNGLRNHLYRKASWLSALAWAWPDSRVPHYAHPYNVLLTYTGGFNPVPGDLQEAALELVQRLYRDATKALNNVAAVTVPGGGSFALVESDGWPRRVLSILQSYRRPVFAAASGAAGLLA